MDTKIDSKIGLVMNEEVKTAKTGKEYRLLTLEYEDGTTENLVCFDQLLKFENDKFLEFIITEDSYGKKITGVQSAPEGEQRKIVPKDNKVQEKSEEPKLYITLNGKTYVTQTGLLNEAHKKGIKSIETEMLEFKDQDIAVVKSKVVMKDGATFTGYGDATKDNVNSMIVKHLLRMAETRATNRALRLATNIGVTSIEELGE